MDIQSNNSCGRACPPDIEAIKMVADHSSTAFCIFSELGEFIYINDAGRQAQFDFFGRHIDSLLEGASYNAQVASDWNSQIQRLNSSGSTRAEWVATYTQMADQQQTHRRCVLQEIKIDGKRYGYSSEVFDVTDLVDANRKLSIDKDRALRGEMAAKEQRAVAETEASSVKGKLKTAWVTAAIAVLTAVTTAAPTIIDKVVQHYITAEVEKAPPNVK